MKRQQHKPGILQRASALALFLLLLAPAVQPVWLFAAPAADDAPCHCPCCQGKCMCSRHARERMAHSGKPQAAEWTSRCSCPMALPVPGHNESYTPPAEAAGAHVRIALLSVRIGFRSAPSPRRSPAHPRRGPPISQQAC